MFLYSSSGVLCPDLSSRDKRATQVLSHSIFTENIIERRVDLQVIHTHMTLEKKTLCKSAFNESGMENYCILYSYLNLSE